MKTVSLKKQAVRGAFWTVLNYGASQLLRFGSNVILTRLLYPELFGLMTLVNITLIGLNLFSDVGIGLSIIQNKRGDEPKFVNTVWTIQVVRGLGLWIFSLLLAYPVSLLYNEPQLLWLIPIVGLTTILSGFSALAPFTLERHLSIAKLTGMELGTQAIQIAIMTLWAWLSPSIWALVMGDLISRVIKMVWTYRLIPNYTHRFEWDKSALRELFSFGRWIFLSTALTFLAEQADRLILGKFFSLRLLGIYGIALMLSDVPRQAVLTLSHRIILPVAAKLSDLPRPEFRRKILRHRSRLLLLLVAGMSVLISFGDLFIRFVYDERYTDAAWMLPILGLGIWPRLLCTTVEPVLLAFGQLQYTTFGNFLRLLSTVVGISLGFVWFGVPGAVVAVALNDLLYYIAVNYGLHREGVGCLVQDAFVTVLLLGSIACFVGGRLLLGWGSPIAGLY